MSTTQLDSIVANKLVPAYENFCFQLLSQLVKEDANINMFVSPIGVAIALAMAYNGARGTTQQAIAKVLGLEGLSLEEFNAVGGLLRSIEENSDSKIQIAFANSLWVKEGILLDENFVRRLRVSYNSEVANLDFTNPEAAAIVNRWIGEKTQKKIQELVTADLIKQAAILVLINVIYFKGIWSYQFDEKRTKEQNFTLSDGSIQPHPMMSQSGENLYYYESEKFQAVSLPYRPDGRVSTYIFLPKLSSSLKEFQALLTGENWRNWMSQFEYRQGKIVLPRFKVEYGKELNKVLTVLGMGEAFSSNANFEGMGSRNLLISEVIHKAFIEVNEVGTAAAAVNELWILLGCSEAKYGFRMIVDRPFFHAIRDNQTGALLFAGFVLNPAA